jgi:hypothetical protein
MFLFFSFQEASAFLAQASVSRQEAGLLLKLLVHPEPEVRGAALTVMAATADDARPPPVTAQVHCKKRFAIFPSPAGMSLIELSLDGNNLIIPAQGEFVH